MKLKIFLVTVGIPVLLWIVLLMVFRSSSKAVDSFIVFAILMSILIRVLTIKRKYLVSLVISQTSLQIHYITPYFKNKCVTVPISAIAAIEFTKANWIVQYPAAVNIKFEDEWLTFEIIQKRLWKEIQIKLVAAGVGAG